MEVRQGAIVGLDDYVALEPESHRYFDKDGREYLSVSKFIGMFKKPFDTDRMSKLSAKKYGVSQAEILRRWEKKKNMAIDHGNRIHDALERFDKTTTIKPENEDLRPTILSISKMYSTYYRRVSEAVLYDTESLVAGTTDKIMQCTSHPKSVVDLDDYKTNLSKGIQFKSDYNDYLLGPLAHLQECNYNTYALQLSIYAYLYQKKSGKNIGMLNILFIPPDDHLSFRRIPVPYMKAEVEAMFEYKRVMESVRVDRSIGFTATHEEELDLSEDF
jgi:hypothetical protein